MLEQKSGRIHIKPFRSEAIPGIISLFLKNFSIVNMVYLIIKHTLYLIKEKFHLVFWLQFHTCKIKQGILSLRRTVSICPILDRHQLIATKKLHKTVFTLLYLIKPFNQPHNWLMRSLTFKNNSCYCLLGRSHVSGPMPWNLQALHYLIPSWPPSYKADSTMISTSQMG